MGKAGRFAVFMGMGVAVLAALLLSGCGGAGKASSYPPAARSNFLAACEAQPGADAQRCGCLYDELKQRLDYRTFSEIDTAILIGAGITDTSEQKVVAAVSACRRAATAPVETVTSGGGVETLPHGMSEGALFVIPGVLDRYNQSGDLTRTAGLAAEGVVRCGISYDDARPDFAAVKVLSAAGAWTWFSIGTASIIELGGGTNLVADTGKSIDANFADTVSCSVAVDGTIDLNDPDPSGGPSSGRAPEPTSVRGLSSADEQQIHAALDDYNFGGDLRTFANFAQVEGVSRCGIFREPGGVGITAMTPYGRFAVAIVTSRVTISGGNDFEKENGDASRYFAGQTPCVVAQDGTVSIGESPAIPAVAGANDLALPQRPGEDDGDVNVLNTARTLARGFNASPQVRESIKTLVQGARITRCGVGSYGTGGVLLLAARNGSWLKAFSAPTMTVETGDDFLYKVLPPGKTVNQAFERGARCEVTREGVVTVVSLQAPPMPSARARRRADLVRARLSQAGYTVTTITGLPYSAPPRVVMETSVQGTKVRIQIFDSAADARPAVDILALAITRGNAPLLADTVGGDLYSATAATKTSTPRQGILTQVVLAAEGADADVLHVG